MPAYKDMTAVQIAQGVMDQSLSAIEIAQEALRLAKTEGRDLNAFINICEDKALAQANAVDENVRAGAIAGPLAGVPIAVKDNISYTDYPMTCASHILDGYVPPYDATVITRLIEAGAVIIGKTNMDEFAMGSSSETSYYGPVKNPRDHVLTPGGSSGGSAAAVAQGIVPIALGSDTGGSIRQPAAFCGILGLKSSYGAVSRYGLAAFASSTDQIGPFARNVKDLSLLFRAICGRDKRDATSIEVTRDSVQSDRKYSIGMPREYFAEGLDPQVGDTIQSLMTKLERQGHKLLDISLPLTGVSNAVYYIISSAEASSNLARYDGTRYGLRVAGDGSLEDMYAETRAQGLGAEVKRRIMLGTHVLSSGYYDEYYVKASKVRALMRREFDAAFESVDLIASPTTPTPPFRLGEKIDDPMAMYLSDVYTTPASLAGIPAISVPCEGGLVGVQFMARYLHEQSLFDIARCVKETA